MSDPRNGTADPAPRAANATESCPQAEDLAAYVDGRLGADDRVAMAEHLSRCQDCYDVVGEVVVGLADEQASGEVAAAPSFGGVSQRVLRSWALPLAATLVLALAGTLLWRGLRPADPYALAVGPLVEAVGEKRLFEPRVTGGFRPGPLASPRRDAGAASSDWALLAEAARLRQGMEGDAQVDERRALATAHLLLGEAAEAVEALQVLAAERTGDADVRSDLAASRLVLYRSRARAEQLPAALEDANQALRIAPDHEEALFNRALALQWLGLRQQAAEAWREAAGRARSEGWRDIAREALRELDQVSTLDREALERRLARGVGRDGSGTELEAAIADSPLVAWEFFEQRLLPALALGDVESARRFAAPFEARTREQTPRRVSEGPVDDPEFRKALREYSAARARYRADDWTQAEELFARAEPALRAADSPLADWAELHRLIFDYQRGAESVPAWARDLGRRVDPDATPMLAGRVEWMRSLIALGAARLAEGFSHASAGERAFRDAGDLASAAYLTGLRAEAFRAAGRPTLAWPDVERSLAAVPRIPDATRAINVYFQVADLARAAALPAAARDFTREALGMARDLGRPLDETEALLRLAQAPGDGGSPLQLLDQARAALARVEDPLVSARLEGEARWLGLTARRSAGTPIAPDEWGQAAEWFLAREDRARSAEALVSQGEGLERAGRIADALRVLDRAFELIAASRRLAEDVGLEHAEQARRVVEAWVRLGAAAAPAESLARIARYLALFHRSNAQPESAEQVLARSRDLSSSARVLVLVPGQGRLDAWLLDRSGLRHIELPGLASAGGGGEAAVIRQLAPHLGGAVRLCVVPLFEAAELPFGMLVASEPSLAGVRSVVLRSRLFPASEPRSSGGLRALAVGVGGAAADLPALPFAEPEATAFAGSSGRVLRGAAATRERVLAELPGATAFYFAGHALLNPERFARSALVLAPSGPDDPGLLTAGEIGRLELGGLQLVVLSACSSAATRTTRTYARRSLADAFLQAGAAAVIGTLHDVSDREVASEMSRVKRAIGMGMAPAEAVLSVQREQYAGRGDAGRGEPGSAAAFVVWES